MGNTDDVISTYVYRDAITTRAQLADGLPVLTTVILHLVSAGMAIYLFILLVKLARRGIKLLDIYINKK